MSSSSSSSSSRSRTLVQYVVVRSDLCRAPHHWPTGALIAQGVHASVAAVWRHRRDEAVVAYCDARADDEAAAAAAAGNDIGGAAGNEQMRTVVLDGGDEGTIRRLSDTLAAARVAHVAWREQPENVLTALATAPCDRAAVQQYFKKLRLFK